MPCPDQVTSFTGSTDMPSVSSTCPGRFANDARAFFRGSTDARPMLSVLQVRLVDTNCTTDYKTGALCPWLCAQLSARLKFGNISIMEVLAGQVVRVTRRL